MAMGVVAWLLWMLFVVLSGVVLLLWGWKSGQFKNIEDPKYRMLQDREPEDWPGRKGDNT
jgi:cbb3-type cytochrome oxidase maturation protein